ncbi:MAG TPA: VOC family protein [Pyrinomonadaceae bacterium]|jgi:catechol 2,3-dioxygenase-like lactoylglutathione lyase family enzyme|nr:VOC family protein [Pyrinomonadaceae bacterium]
MTLTAVHHVQISIPVGGEDKARDFYCRVLGLNEIPKPDSLAGRGGFWLELGATQIHFGAEDGIDRSKTKGHTAYLVSDLESWRSKLTAAGCEIVDGIPVPGLDRFEFRDPFGNRVEFLEAHVPVAK